MFPLFADTVTALEFFFAVGRARFFFPILTHPVAAVCRVFRITRADPVGALCHELLRAALPGGVYCFNVDVSDAVGVFLRQ